MPQARPLHLAVRTASGKTLGHVVDIDVDTQTQGITAYHVKPSRLLPDMVTTTLLIRPSQVIEFTADAMIVDDASTGTEVAPQSTAAA